jgi:hypothetical protein
MSNLVSYAHGATGAVGIQGFALTATLPTTVVTLNVKNWTGTLSYAQHNTSNTSTPGWTTTQTGKGTLKASIDCNLLLNTADTSIDSAHNPLAVAGVNLPAGYVYVILVGGTTAAGAAVTSVTTSTAGQLFSCYAAIETIKINNAEGDVIDCTIDIMSTGVVTINAGS